MSRCENPKATKSKAEVSESKGVAEGKNDNWNPEEVRGERTRREKERERERHTQKVEAHREQ